MTRKTAVISFKCSPEERAEFEMDAKENGFEFSSGKTNFSKYLRWILKHSQRPIHRDHYKEMRVFAHDLSRMGSLFNQYVFHLNRELKILNDRGLHDQSNKRIARELELTMKKFDDMFDTIIKTHDLVLDSVKEESA